MNQQTLWLLSTAQGLAMLIFSVGLRVLVS
jgi:hypothetical protein